MRVRTQIPTPGAAPWLLASIVLVGCATPQQQSSLECGLGAAVGGYALCKLFGNSDRHCAQFAAGAGAVGAVACYTYANRLEKRRQELAGKEQNLDAQLAYVRGLNEDGQQLNKELRGRVEVATKRVNDLQVQIAKGGVKADVLAKERKQLDEEVKEAGKQVALQGDALNEAKSFQAKRTQKSPDLDLELAKQEQLLAEARRQLAALTQQRERVA
jgi:hypothetical protein